MHYDDSTISGTAPMYDRKQILGISGDSTINGTQRDNQWRIIDGDSTINGAASTISQSVNRGASDVRDPKFDAARSETDGVPHLNANNQRRNGFLQYESRDGGQNMSKASEFEFA